jgi:hypothetical protein
MNKISAALLYSIVVSSLLSACIPATPPQPTSTSTPTQPTLTPTPVSLAVYGQYGVGKIRFTLTDSQRDNHKVFISVWYPAIQVAESTAREIISDGEPDRSGAPYPLILSSTKMAETMASYLVSHGFIWVSVDYIDSYFSFYKGAIDQPLDILYALEQVASNPPESLKGMLDTDHAGTIGYSFDGFNSLAMSGARIDPAYYLAQCPTPDATTKAVINNLSAFSCAPARIWDEFTAYFDESITYSEDGLWQPITDERIQAVMPMAGEGWWLFGERGLAAVDKPILMIVATDDSLYKENALIYEHLGTPDKRLISFIGKDHMMIFESDYIERMANFATAFFGYYLQGREDQKYYFSEDFVTQFNDLAWGVYPSE